MSRLSRSIGILREVKNKWERRVPLIPEAVEQLVKKGIEVRVQPSERRIFKDEEFRKVGAVITDDLSPANIIFGVKEFPRKDLIANKSYMIFSHTIKAQPYNMPFLDYCLQKNIRLFDYECIRAPHKEGGQRLVAFGKYAGICGMVDIFRGLGARLLALGYSTPFMGVSSAYMYPSVDDAKEAICRMGREIGRVGVTSAIRPMTFVFTGQGNVTQGCLDIFKLVPHEFVSPADLPYLAKSNPDPNKLYGCMVSAQDMVAPGQPGTVFNKADYYANPQNYRPVFHERIAPYTNVLVNGMYWDAKYPRLLNLDQMEELEKKEPGKLLMVGDITCDIGGSVESLVRASNLDDPFYLYDPLSRQTFNSIEGRGVLMMGVDNLPAEAPREASRHFSNALLPFVEALAEPCDPATPFASVDLPPQVKNACITWGNELTPSFQYIQKLRNQNEAAAKAEEKAQEQSSTVVPAESEGGLPKVTLLLEGHLFDSGLINQALDLIEHHALHFRVLHWDIGPNKRSQKSTSSAVVELTAATSEQVSHIISALHTLAKLVPASQATIQQLPFYTPASAAVAAAAASVGMSVPAAAAPVVSASKPTPAPAAPAPQVATPQPTSSHVSSGSAKRVLVLGSGYVSGPVLDYLTRQATGSSHATSNQVTLASLDLEQAKRMTHQNPAARALHLDASDPQALEEAVKNSDIVVSLLPATAHVPVAQFCIQHRKPMVTASYISPDMRRLHVPAARAGVAILNEIGLDPGIDHMSAMAIIDGVRDTGGRIEAFESVCGGLPAPEAANNPLGYKFSWSPRGVLMAATQGAIFRRQGAEIRIEGRDLLRHAEPALQDVLPAFRLEQLPNRNSLQYAPSYGIESASTVFRGTLRYEGFCNTMYCMAQLGLLDTSPNPAAIHLHNNLSWRELLIQLSGAAGSDLATVLRAKLQNLASHLAPPQIDKAIHTLEWLGMLSDMRVDWRGSVLDSFCGVLQDKLKYDANERDMVLLHHNVIASYPDTNSKERITSTLLCYGEVGGYSAMARTVGLPTAIATQLLLDGSITRKGVLEPTPRDIYVPILKRLAEQGISCSERVSTF